MSEDANRTTHFFASRSVLPGVLALFLVFSAGCKKPAAPVTVVTVQAAHPVQGPIAAHFTVDAVLAPVAEAAIEPKISAPVRKFYVQRGSRVKAGELLATLEASDLAAAALDSKGLYMAAQAEYATATRAQVPEETQRAELDAAAAKATLNLNQSIVKSRKQLFAEGAIPGRDLDTAEAALVEAQAAYDVAENHLQAVESVSRAAALKAAAGQLTSARGRFEGAQAQLNYAEIRSPIDGVVTDRPLFAGETAAVGTPLLTVMDTSSLLAKAHIAESMALQLKAGDVAAVRVPGMGAQVAATVALVSPALDPGSTTVEVWIKIDNRSGRLKVGTPVKVEMAGPSVAQAWKIPASAILTAQDGSKSVMVVGADGTAQRKPVTLGIEDSQQVQITGGLSPSDLVITSGSYGLDEGTKVKVSASGGDPANAAGEAGGNG